MGLTGLANFQLLKDFPLDLAVSDLRGEVRTFRELYEWPAHRQPAVAKIWLAVSNDSRGEAECGGHTTRTRSHQRSSYLPPCRNARSVLCSWRPRGRCIPVSRT